MQMSEKELASKVKEISRTDPKKCMKCGKCSASCPSFDEMEYHPHQFVSMVVNGEIEPLLNSKSITKCLTCFACVERCPRGVEPANIIEAIRVLKLRQQGACYLDPDEVPGLLTEELPQQALVSAFRKYRK